MIYLDHAAATPLLPQARAAAEPYLAEDFFNPSAPYLPAKRVREAYENARATIAHSLGAKTPDLIITAGATESINLAFTVLNRPGAEPIGSPDSSDNPAAPTGNPTEPTTHAKPRVLLLATEHAAVLASAAPYPHALIKVDQFGLVDLDDFKAKLTPEVELVSISLANNELGSIQSMGEIAELIRAERYRRLTVGETTPLHLHSDASQALNLLDVNVARLGVDLLTINAAKIYGPKGIGALYVSHGTRLQPIVRGGGQEQGLRSGTENVAATIAFATAVQHARQHLGGNRKRYKALSLLLRTELEQRLHTATPQQEIIFLGQPKHQLANFVPVCYPGIDAERLIYRLEDQGVLVATGAACAASKGQKSHVLAAIGLSDREIAGSLRLTLGALNDEDNIKEAARLITDAVLAELARSQA